MVERLSKGKFLRQVHEDIEAVEFQVQYCYGRVMAADAGSAAFHIAYTGPKTSCLVRRLRAKTPYSFRVCCRTEEEKWSTWSVPRTAITSISHYGG